MRNAILVAAMLVLPALSHAMSEMQMARDGHRVRINKDIGDERWSMMYDSDDHTWTLIDDVTLPGGFYMPPLMSPPAPWPGMSRPMQR